MFFQGNASHNLHYFISLNEITNAKGPAWSLAHSRPHRNALFSLRLILFLYISILLPLLLFKSHIGREFRIPTCLCWLVRTNEHNTLLLGVKHSLHVLVGERLVIVGCKEAMFMQFALPPPATVSSTDGVLVYSREK